jgi:hypothetical protein
MPGPTQPWDQPEDPRDQTVDLPRIDLTSPGNGSAVNGGPRAYPRELGGEPPRRNGHPQGSGPAAWLAPPGWTEPDGRRGPDINGDPYARPGDPLRPGLLFERPAPTAPGQQPSAPPESRRPAAPHEPGRPPAPHESAPHEWRRPESAPPRAARTNAEPREPAARDLEAAPREPEYRHGAASPDAASADAAQPGPHAAQPNLVMAEPSAPLPTTGLESPGATRPGLTPTAPARPEPARPAPAGPADDLGGVPAASLAPPARLSPTPVITADPEPEVEREADESSARMTAGATAPAVSPARRPQPDRQAADPRAGRRPASLAELRSRLDRLPDGHPSSPYDDGGLARPLPHRLRQLELGLPAPEREAAESMPRSGQPIAAPRPEPDADQHRRPAPATPPTTTPPTTTPPTTTPAATMPAADTTYAPPPQGLSAHSDSRPAPAGGQAAGGQAATPDGATTNAHPRPAVSNGNNGHRYDSAAPWQDPYAPLPAAQPGGAPPPARLYSAPLPSARLPSAPQPSAPRHADGNGHSPPDRRPDPGTQPYPQLKPYADPPGTGLRAGSKELKSEHEDLVARLVADGRAAEGQTVFGGYGASGLTPAIRRIAAQIGRGGLAPGSDSTTLKTAERLSAKLSRLIARHPDRTAEELAAGICDVVRYAFAFEPDYYSEGTWLVHRKFKSQGFELEARRNRWESPEYKGIWTRWRDPASDLAFEVQFHTFASWDVAASTHEAYRLITDPATPPAERARLRARQVSAAAAAKAPPDCGEISDFGRETR